MDVKRMQTTAGSIYCLVDDRGTITLHVKHTADVREILSAITTVGSPLPGLDVRKPSLEEVFLGLTGDELYGGVMALGAST